jgi:hypothetical protein
MDLHYLNVAILLSYMLLRDSFPKRNLLISGGEIEERKANILMRGVGKSRIQTCSRVC